MKIGWRKYKNWSPVMGWQILSLSFATKGVTIGEVKKYGT